MSNEERAATRNILEYLQRQPGAKHTAEGIAKYWIFQQRLEESLEIVMTAIKYLIKSGFLEEICNEDTRCFYRLNQEQIGEISQTLKMLESTRS